MISKNEMILYIKGLQKSCEETHKILRKYYELITKDFEDILNSTEEGMGDCEKRLIEKFAIFNKSFSEIENYVECELIGDLKMEDGEDGWMVISEEARELSMTRIDNLDSIF